MNFIRFIAPQIIITITAQHYTPPQILISKEKNILSLFLEKLDSVFSYIRDRHVGCELIMHGDFIINLLSVQSNGLCSDYLLLIYSYNLLPAILRPTRVSNTFFTLIDNIWFGSCADFSKSGIIMSNITDHYAIFSVFGERQTSSSDAYM